MSMIERTLSSPGSLTACIHNLRSPNQRLRDEAAQMIWDRFSTRLQLLVRRHLDNRIRRREDELDVLQSTYTSFCLGQMEGKAIPASREELWKLLVRISLCKLVNTAQRHTAARRDVRRERPKVGDGGDSYLIPQWMLEHVDANRPTADEQCMVIDELERLLSVLPEKHRQIVLWKIDGYKNAEIAVLIGRTVRSVELKLQLIRKRLEQTSFGIEANFGGRGTKSTPRPETETIEEDSSGDGDVE